MSMTDLDIKKPKCAACKDTGFSHKGQEFYVPCPQCQPHRRCVGCRRVHPARWEKPCIGCGMPTIAREAGDP